jgi:hypothetical protein
MFLYNSNLLASQIKYGLKLGGNISWQYFQSNSYHVQEDGNHEIKIRPSFGFFIESKCSKKIKILAELSLINLSQQFSCSTALGAIPQTKINYQNIFITTLLKFQFDYTSKPYFLFGPGFIFPLKSHYEYKDLIYGSSDSGDVTSNLPKLETSIVFGIGKIIKIRMLRLLSEIRYLAGITSYPDIKDNFPSEWRNQTVQFILGFYIKDD